MKVMLKSSSKKCSHCRRKYDLNKASRIADRMGTLDMFCPHCGKVDGRLQS